jgi:hypothetical protein
MTKQKPSIESQVGENDADCARLSTQPSGMTPATNRLLQHQWIGAVADCSVVRWKNQDVA